ncbi:MAG: hypothetical protein ABI904_02460 [Chloroflexota bacterium]
MSGGKRVSIGLTLFFHFMIMLALLGCQAQAVINIPTITPSPAPTATPVPPKNVLWVDTTRDLGLISKHTLGGNHGPWSEFSLDAFQKTIDLGVTFIRWPGGNWGDRNDIRTLMIDTYIGEVRKIGAEPSISVRVPGGSPGRAAELVRYVNITKGYGVKYWNIGNEPNLYDNDPALNNDVKWTPQLYAKVWREFATAMRAVDPTILFYGPDISQFIGDSTAAPTEGDALDYLKEFLRVDGDMVNIVTVHRYPFPTCSNCGNPTWVQLRDNTAEWDNTLPNLRRIIKEITGKELPVGVTEYNSNYSNAVGADTSPDSFYNALWLADVYGRLVRQRPEMLAYWLLKNNDGGAGLLTSFDVRPSYYSFVMWKKFGNHLLAASSDTQYTSVYASKTEDGTVTVMLVNLNDKEVQKPLQLNGGDQLKLEQAFLFDAKHNAEPITPPKYTNNGAVTLPAESVMLLIFH